MHKTYTTGLDCNLIRIGIGMFAQIANNNEFDDNLQVMSCYFVTKLGWYFVRNSPYNTKSAWIYSSLGFSCVYFLSIDIFCTSQPVTARRSSSARRGYTSVRKSSRTLFGMTVLVEAVVAVYYS